MNPIFAEVRAVQCTAEILINDIPIGRITGPAQPFFARPPVPLLRNGPNTLELIVEPGVTPSRSREGRIPLKRSGARASAQVKSYREGQWVGSDEGESLCRLSWPVQNTTPEYSPLVMKKILNFRHSWGAWAWERAEILDLDRERSGLLNSVAAWHAAFAAGQAEPFVRLCETHLFPELVKVYPEATLSMMREKMTANVQGNRGRTGWVRPLDLSKLDLRLVAEGRLVQLIYADWGPVFDTLPQSDGDAFPFNVLVGRLDRVWHIFRWL